MKRIFKLSALLLALAGCSKNENTASEDASGAKISVPVKLAGVQAVTPDEAPPKPAAEPAAPTAPSVPAVAAPTTVAVAAPDLVPSVSGDATKLGTQLTPPNVDTNAAPKSAWDKVGRLMGNLPNRLNPKAPGDTNSPSGTMAGLSAADLPTDQITRGLKEALGKGLDHAISQLGKDGGFLTNLNVRIPVPEKLQGLEKILRRAGQDKLADDFETTMNRAAEKAVPAAAGVFNDSLKQMTVEDARAILQGPKDAATQYFRKTTGTQLEAKFKPIVSEATSQAGVTAAYKNLLDKAGFASAFLKQESVDLDGYVTSKATDGLFKMVADEEKKIRENPVARTTDLLKSVFGAFGR